MNRLQERAEFLIQQSAQIEVAERRGEGRQHELGARKAEDTLPIDSRRAHHRAKLF